MFIGDALGTAKTIDFGRLVTGWRHAVILGRWLWRSRMARHFCNASQFANTTAKTGVQHLECRYEENVPS